MRQKRLNLAINKPFMPTWNTFHVNFRPLLCRFVKQKTFILILILLWKTLLRHKMDEMGFLTPSKGPFSWLEAVKKRESVNL